MLCNSCLKDVNAKGICKSCFKREQAEGDKLAIRLTKEIAKVRRLEEIIKKLKSIK